MILVNTDYIAGQELEMLGLVKGSTIQSKNIGRDISRPWWAANWAPIPT